MTAVIRFRYCGLLVLLIVGMICCCTSCRVGRLLVGLSGGEQKYMVDRVTTLVNHACGISIAMVHRAYGDSEPDTLPEGVTVSHDRRTGLYTCVYDHYYDDKRRLCLNGTYALLSHDGAVHHTVKMSFTEKGADDITLDIDMTLYSEPYGKTRYHISRCRVNDKPFSSEALIETQIAAQPIVSSDMGDSTSAQLLP